MTLAELYPPPSDLASQAHIRSLEEYEKLYKLSLEDPDTFWSKQAEEFHWEKKWDTPVLRCATASAAQLVCPPL